MASYPATDRTAVTNQPRKYGLKAAVLAVFTAVATILIGVLATPSASASAYGCTPYTDIRVEGVSPANWCGGPVGDGHRVDSVNASFASGLAGVGYLCDTSMKVEVFDDQGRSVWTRYTPIEYGCFQPSNIFEMSVCTTFPTDGHIETSLLSYGATKATLSHNIHG